MEDSPWKQIFTILKHTSGHQAIETQSTGTLNLFHLISHSPSNDCFNFVHYNALDEKNNHIAALSLTTSFMLIYTNIKPDKIQRQKRPLQG